MTWPWSKVTALDLQEFFEKTLLWEVGDNLYAECCINTYITFVQLTLDFQLIYVRFISTELLAALKKVTKVGKIIPTIEYCTCDLTNITRRSLLKIVNEDNDLRLSNLKVENILVYNKEYQEVIRETQREIKKLMEN